MSVCQSGVTKGSETLTAFEGYLKLPFSGKKVKSTVQEAPIGNYRSVMMWEVVVKCGK